ncbi:MAG: hypothetical protein QOI05_2582 [Bradyrhizobium sp.]|nr:hypothetical protein [Bradyrhizobium sp.]
MAYGKALSANAGSQSESGGRLHSATPLEMYFTRWRRWAWRPHAAAPATSSSPRLRGSTPQAHTTTIWITTRPIISQTTPGNW